MISKGGSESADLPYRYLIPPGYDAAQRYPLIVFLHGSGERGTDNITQLAKNGNGSLQWVSGQNQTAYPAFMLAPQLAAGEWTGSVLDEVARAIAALSAQYSIDQDRIYITGLSYGGAGTYSIAARYPDLFAAAVPMSGYLEVDASRLITMPIWTFHAADDPSVFIGRDDMAVQTIRSAGGNVIYTRYATGGHVIWPTAYNNPYVLPWLMAQKRHQPAHVAPFIKITSPESKYPALNTAGAATYSGTAAFPNDDAFDVRWSFTPSNEAVFVDGSNASFATGTTSWSVSQPQSAGKATYFMAIARGPSWASGTGSDVGGGTTTVNDLVWVLPTSAALTAPTVTVTAPSSGTQWNTSADSIDLSGTLETHTNQAVQQVTWENDRGGIGIGTMNTDDTAWTISGVSLQPGDNQITVRARDELSVWGSATLLVHAAISGGVAAPVIQTQPTNVFAASGASATLSVAVAGGDSANYQWSKDGQPLASSTGSTLTFAAIQPSDAGNYSVQVSNDRGTVTSTTVAVTLDGTPSSRGRLMNLSARAGAGTGNQTLIVGFIVNGTGKLPVLLRALGPTLKGAPFNVPDALSDPQLKLFHGPDVVSENDDWASGAGVASVSQILGVYSLDPASKDAAISTAVDAGANTAHVLSSATQSGVVLAEVYDASGAIDENTPRLANISARSEVGTGDRVLIGGFIVGGNGPVTVLIRATGPGLQGFGVGNLLSDPALELHSANAILQSNDNWSDASNATDVAATSSQLGSTLASGSKDAALLVTLVPGAYTAIVRGSHGSTGVALLEIYEIR